MMSIHLIHASAGTPWHLDSKFWVAIPVVLFLALVIYKGALKALSASLDARSDAIRSELDEARPNNYLRLTSASKKRPKHRLRTL